MRTHPIRSTAALLVAAVVTLAGAARPAAAGGPSGTGPRRPSRAAVESPAPERLGFAEWLLDVLRGADPRPRPSSSLSTDPEPVPTPGPTPPAPTGPDEPVVCPLDRGHCPIG